MFRQFAKKVDSYTFLTYGMPFPPPETLVNIIGGADVDIQQDDAEDSSDTDVLEYTQHSNMMSITSTAIRSSLQAKDRFCKYKRNNRQIQTSPRAVEKQPGARLMVEISVTTKPKYRLPYLYVCGCRNKEVAISEYKHAQMKKGHVYQCKSCKKSLTFKNKVKSIVSRFYRVKEHSISSFNKTERNTV